MSTGSAAQRAGGIISESREILSVRRGVAVENIFATDVYNEVHRTVNGLLMSSASKSEARYPS